jgi:beta-lactamase class A
MRRTLLLATTLLISLPAFAQQKEDASLDTQLQSIAAAHHGKVALYAENLRTHQTASVSPDLPVQTASTIKLAILLDAAEQIRAGKASFDEKLILTHENQVPGSGIIGQLDTPLPLTLRDVLHLMVTLSDNTATNMAIDRLGLDHINQTIEKAGLHQTWLYKKVYKPASGPMPADQPKFGLGKTTPHEMASLMTRLVTCNLPIDNSPSLPADGPICGKILQMLRVQQDRDGLPRYVESLDTSEQGTAIGNKTGALDRVRADVAVIGTKSGPIVIAAYTFDNQDQRWTGDNEGKITMAKIGEAIIKAWSPTGLDPAAVHWDNPLAPSSH